MLNDLPVPADEAGLWKLLFDVSPLVSNHKLWIGAFGQFIIELEVVSVIAAMKVPVLFFTTASHSKKSLPKVHLPGVITYLLQDNLFTERECNPTLFFLQPDRNLNQKFLVSIFFDPHFCFHCGVDCEILPAAYNGHTYCTKEECQLESFHPDDRLNYTTICDEHAKFSS